MHETLPCYLVLEVGAKLAKCFRGHLRAPHAISCISCVLLYDWPSHLREQINRTFQFRNCHGKFFCSFDVSMEAGCGMTRKKGIINVSSIVMCRSKRGYQRVRQAATRAGDCICQTQTAKRWVVCVQIYFVLSVQSRIFAQLVCFLKIKVKGGC